MRARVLFAGLVAISTAVIGGPASAKASIAGANITGPGLDGGLRIEAPDTEGLWESGIDVVGGLDDTRADSVKQLGLTPADLGPRYLVTYRFEFSDDLIRQDLYPYAKGGPVTYTPPGQELTVGVKMQITAGWYQSTLGFFQYLLDHGLSETDGDGVGCESGGGGGGGDGGAGGGGGGDCDPSYPGVCIPPYPPDLDCDEVPYNNFEVVGSDPHGFDGDNDGVGCET